MARGFLLIDKEGGWTSHDVVAKCRGILRQKRIGHAGTLDPMATGLLVLGVGRATRLLRFIQDTPKTYVASAIFGVATDTLDADGSIISREEMPVEEKEVRAAAKRFVGTIPQIPPMVSAVKVDGKRLYDLARQGVEVERSARQVAIHSFDIEDFAPGSYPEVKFRVVCGSGTYVRVLADDLARALGGRAYLTELRRLSIGGHHVDDAWTIERLEGADDPTAAVLSASRGLSHLEAVTVSEETARGVGNGVVFTAAAFLPTPGRYRVLDGEGTLLAVYLSDGRRATPEVVMPS